MTFPPRRLHSTLLSRLFKKVFQNVMQGGAIGVDRGTGGLMKSVDSAVSSVKRDLSGISGVNVPIQGTGFSAGGGGGLSAADMAQAVKQALQGAGVYMDGRRVGQLVTTQQNNNTRARGAAPAYG